MVNSNKINPGAINVLKCQLQLQKFGEKSPKSSRLSENKKVLFKTTKIFLD